MHTSNSITIIGRPVQKTELVNLSKDMVSATVQMEYLVGEEKNTLPVRLVNRQAEIFCEFVQPNDLISFSGPLKSRNGMHYLEVESFQMLGGRKKK